MTANPWKKSWTKSTLTGCCAALVLGLASFAARAGAFTPGNIVVERLGDGTQALANTGDTIFFDEYTTTGGAGQTPVNSLQISNNGASALIDNGTASTGGAITLSPDGELLCFPGYATNEPFSESLSTTTTTAVPRGVGTLNANGVYQLAATTTTEYSTTTIRGATTDGQGNFWTSGGSLSGAGGGLNYLGNNNPAANLTDGTFRHLCLFGTNLWFDVQNSSGGGGDNLGVYEFTGAPMTAAAPTRIFTLTGSSTYGLSINNPANPTVIYFADATLSGIHKWINNNGVWSQACILFSNNVFGLTVDWSTAPATLYATTTGAGNKLVRIVDNGPASVAITNATARPNQILRGVAFAPIAILAARLLPALNGARQKAQSIRCLNNLRQWGLSFTMYSQDNQEVVPEEGEPGNQINDPGRGTTFNNLNAWYNLVAPAISQPRLVDLYYADQPPVPGNPSLYACPAATIPGASLGFGNPPNITKALFMYVMNCRICVNFPSVQKGLPQNKFTMFSKPTDTILVAELNAAYPGTDPAHSNCSGIDCSGRHSYNTRGNFSMCDGSARSARTNDFLRTSAEADDDYLTTGTIALEWQTPRSLYWYPNPLTPN
jgi:hypothetical protein